MEIPTFKEKVVPVHEMEQYLTGRTTEGKQLKLILESIKEYKLLPKFEDMVLLLDYEVKAIDYAFKLAINTLNNKDFEKNYFSHCWSLSLNYLLLGLNPVQISYS